MSTTTSPTETQSAVMAHEAAAPRTPFEVAQRDFVFGQVWNRPGLSVRDRRVVTLACLGAADVPALLDEHTFAALRNDELTVEQLNEITLHFAVYCGWPKASVFEASVRTAWARLHAERGEPAPPFPAFNADDLGPEPPEERLAAGRESYEEVNLTQPPPPTSPYFHSGVVGFVFGHVWRRPALSRRDRRLVTLPCVGVSDAATPIMSHVTSALSSGDLSYEEVHELILQVSAYYGFAKGQALHDVAEQWNVSRT